MSLAFSESICLSAGPPASVVSGSHRPVQFEPVGLAASLGGSAASSHRSSVRSRSTSRVASSTCPTSVHTSRSARRRDAHASFPRAPSSRHGLSVAARSVVAPPRVVRDMPRPALGPWDSVSHVGAPHGPSIVGAPVVPDDSVDSRLRQRLAAINGTVPLPAFHDDAERGTVRGGTTRASSCGGEGGRAGSVSSDGNAATLRPGRAGNAPPVRESSVRSSLATESALGGGAAPSCAATASPSRATVVGGPYDGVRITRLPVRHNLLVVPEGASVEVLDSAGAHIQPTYFADEAARVASGLPGPSPRAMVERARKSRAAPCSRRRDDAVAVSVGGLSRASTRTQTRGSNSLHDKLCSALSRLGMRDEW